MLSYHNSPMLLLWVFIDHQRNKHKYQPKQTSSVIKGLLFFCKLDQLKKEKTKSDWWVKGWHVFDFTILCRSPSEFVGGIENFTTLWYCDETDLTFYTGKPRNCIVYEWKNRKRLNYWHYRLTHALHQNKKRSKGHSPTTVILLYFQSN